MQVGDLVVQMGWEADGTGIVMETDNNIASVQWTGGIVRMYFSDLVVISASR